MKITVFILIGFTFFGVSIHAQPGYNIQESAPIVKIELPSSPFYEQAWFNTLIAALLGISGTVLGYQLTANRDDKIRMEEQERNDERTEEETRQRFIREMSTIKAKADGLIHKLTKNGIDFVWMEEIYDSEAPNKKHLWADKLMEAEEKYNNTLSDYLTQLSLFETYLGEPWMWNEMINQLREFPQMLPVLDSGYEGKKQLEDFFHEDFNRGLTNFFSDLMNAFVYQMIDGNSYEDARSFTVVNYLSEKSEYWKYVEDKSPGSNLKVGDSPNAINI